MKALHGSKLLCASFLALFKMKHLIQSGGYSFFQLFSVNHGKKIHQHFTEVKLVCLDLPKLPAVVKNTLFTIFRKFWEPVSAALKFDEYLNLE